MARVALDKGHAKLFFQAYDAPAQARFGDTAARAGGREPARLDHLDRQHQVVGSATAQLFHAVPLATTKSFQNCAPCVVAKLMRISVLGSRRAWNSEPGANR